MDSRCRRLSSARTSICRLALLSWAILSAMGAADEADAATFLETIQGHDMIFLNPREVTFFFLVVVAVCTLLNILLTFLETHDSPLVQSAYASSTRAILVIGINTVLLAFVTGFLDSPQPPTDRPDGSGSGAAKQDEKSSNQWKYLIVLNWVYFVFFFLLVFLVVYSSITIVLLHFACRTCDRAEEDTMTELGGEGVVRAKGAEGRKLGALLLTLRTTMIASIQVSNSERPHADQLKYVNPVPLRYSLYLKGLQKWDAGALTNLTGKDWALLLVFCMVNALRRLGLSYSPAVSTGPDDYFVDYTTFVFVMGLIPFGLYVAGAVLQRRNFFAYLDALQDRHSSVATAGGKLGHKKSEFSFRSLQEFDSPYDYAFKGKLDESIVILRGLTLIQIFFTVVLVVDFAFIANPLELIFAFLPLLLVLASSPWIMLMSSVLTSMGPVGFVDDEALAMIRALGADVKAGQEAETIVYDDDSEMGSEKVTTTAELLGLGKITTSLLANRDRSGHGTHKYHRGRTSVPMLREEEEPENFPHAPLAPFTDVGAAGEAEVEMMMKRRVNGRAEDQKYRAELQERDRKSADFSLASLSHPSREETMRLEQEFGSAFLSMDATSSTFHLYCALESARRVLEEEEERNKDLIGKAKNERRISAEVVTKTALVRDVLCDRKSIFDMPDNLEWCTIMDSERSFTEVVQVVPNLDGSLPPPKPVDGSTVRPPRFSEDWRKLLQKQPHLSAAWAVPPPSKDELKGYLS